MTLFEDDKLKDFFNPLTGCNKKIHYDCIKILIGLTIKYQSELYESDARDSIARYLYENSLELNDEDGFYYSTVHSPVEKASQEIKYLRAKGWIAERDIARNGESLANVTYSCMRLISSIDQIFNDKNSGTLSNLLVNIHNILKELTDTAWSPRKDRPYISGVRPLYESAYKLREEMAAFRVNIRQIRPSIIKINNLEDLNAFYLHDPGNEKILEDYRYITKDGRFPQYVSEIAENMRAFLSDTALQEKVAKEYSQSEELSSDITPEERLESMYSDIQNYFEYGYNNDVDTINKRLNEYIELIHTRLRLITSSEKNLASELDEILVAMSDMEESKRNEFLENIFDGVLLYSNHKILEPRSISNKINGKKTRKEKTQPVLEESLSDEEKATLTNEWLESVNSKYSSAKVSEYLYSVTNGKKKKVLENDDIKNIDDVLYFMSSLVHSDSDPDFPYEITLNDSVIDNKYVHMSGMNIERRRN